MSKEVHHTILRMSQGICLGCEQHNSTQQGSSFQDDAIQQQRKRMHQVIRQEMFDPS